MANTVKRSRSVENGDHEQSPESPVTEQSPRSAIGTVSAFRNVSACHRCRQRKNKCDHRLPACVACEKARVNCVGYDLTTRREVPRSYIFYLETRISYLEQVLKDQNIQFEPPDNLELSSTPGKYPEGTFSPLREAFRDSRLEDDLHPQATPRSRAEREPRPLTDAVKREREEIRRFEAQVNQIPGGGASDKRCLGSAQGITFARVVIACLRDKKGSDGSNQVNGKDKKIGPSRPNTGMSMRDAFFGLHSKPSFRRATFPDRGLGLKLVELYMDYANPQIPILHRDEFMTMFNEVYSQPTAQQTPKQQYFLNIVFAIGSGIILGGSDLHNASQDEIDEQDQASDQRSGAPHPKRRRTSSHQHQPGEYYASAMFFLEPLLGAERGDENRESFGGLEELQAVLLLAAYALLRPTTPGLWYIVGVGTRLAKDLGLHYEHEQTDLDCLIEVGLDGRSIHKNTGSAEQGRREYMRDMRRRLWWCAYSFDRLVSTCVGRPLGISDDSILAKFPSLVDDAYIKPTGIVHRINENDAPSYKRVAWHYFRLRILQAEVLDVLLQRNIIRLEAAHPEIKNRYLHDRMKWGHLAEPQAFREWRDDMDRRLMEWKDTAPTSTEETSVRFATEFFELNYWQVIIMLYRQNLNVPIEYGGDLGSPDDNQGRNVPHNDDLDPDEKIPMKIFEAATKILHLYRHLHKRRLVNWTYLATHAIFITAVSLLYAVWHSAAVRENILSSEMKSYIDDGIFVLGDLAPMCPPAADLREKLTMLYRAVHWQYAVWLKAELDERQKLHGEPKDGRRGGRVPTANQMQQPMLSGSQLGALTRHHPSLDGRLMATAETSTATTPRSSMFSPSSTTSMSYQSVPSPNYNPIRSAPDTRDQYSAPYQPPFNPTPSRVQAQARMSQLQPYPAFSSHLPPHQQPRQRPFEYPPQTNLYAQPYQQEPQPLAYDLDPAVYRDLDLGLGLPYDFSAVFPPQVPLDTGAGAGTDPSSPSTAHDRMQDVDVDAAEAEPYPMTGNEHMTGYDMGGFIKLGHDMGAQGMPIGGQFFHPDFEGFFFGGGNENMGANGLNGYGGVDGGDGQQQQQEGEYGQGY